MLFLQCGTALHEPVTDELEKDKCQQKISLVCHGGPSTQIVSAGHQDIFQSLLLGSLGSPGFSRFFGSSGSSFFSSFSGHGFYPFSVKVSASSLRTNIRLRNVSSRKAGVWFKMASQAQQAGEIPACCIVRSVSDY